MVTVKDILRIAEKGLNDFGYYDEIDIVRGSITLNVQIENSVPTVLIKEKEIVKVK